MNGLLLLFSLVAAFVVLPAFIGALIAVIKTAIVVHRTVEAERRLDVALRPTAKRNRSRNIKKRPDALKAVRLGQTILM